MLLRLRNGYHPCYYYDIAEEALRLELIGTGMNPVLAFMYHQQILIRSLICKVIDYWLYPTAYEIGMKDPIPALREHTGLPGIQTGRLRIASQGDECGREPSSMHFLFHCIPVSLGGNYLSSLVRRKWEENF